MQQSKSAPQGRALPALIARYKPNLVVIPIGETPAGDSAAPDLRKDFIAKKISGLLQPIRADNVGLRLDRATVGYLGRRARVGQGVGPMISQIVAPYH